VEDSEDQEVLSPLKTNQKEGDPSQAVATGASRRLDMQVVEEKRRSLDRKRKNKGSGEVMQTPYLNIPLGGSNALVLVGLVNSRVNQLDSGAETSGDSMVETLKKQRRGTTPNARSAAAVSDSPRWAQ
jgi:hypothetical protein